MKRLATILLIPLSILLILGLVEAASYLFEIKTKAGGNDNPLDPLGISNFSCVREDLLGYRLKPNAHFGNIGINSLGYAGKEFSLDKEEGVFRIVCVGGSTTFSTGIESHKYAWPEALEGLLNGLECKKNVKRIEVINAGVPGYHTWHSRLRLPELYRLKPDLLLFMDGFNDVNASSSLSENAFENLDERRFLTMLASGGDTTLNRLFGYLDKSRAYRVGVNLVARAKESQFSQNLDSKIKVFNTEKNLDFIIEDVKRHGIMLAIINHPWSPRQSGAGAYPSEMERMMPGHMLAGPEALKAYMWGRGFISELNRRLSQRWEVPVLDPQPAVDAASIGKRGMYQLFSRDIIHLTEYGNSLLASELFNQLLGLPQIRSALGVDADCAAQAAASASPPIMEPAEIDWGSGWMGVTRQDIGLSPPIMFNVHDKPMEYDDWGFYGPKDISAPASISIGVAAKPGENLLFFMPRIARGQGSIALFIHVNGERRELSTFDDFPGIEPWSPIAGRHVVDLSPVQDWKYILEFVLSGKFAQLWHDKDGNVLFFR